MSYKKYLLLPIIAFLGCTDIPDELRDDAKSDGTCGNSIYNPSTSFCYEGNVYLKCNGIKYNPTTQICQGIAVTSAVCGGRQYNPLEEKCLNNGVGIKCGTGVYYYNTETQFCIGNSVYNKCSNKEYDPLSQRCESDVIKTKCGAGVYYYNPSTQFCSGNSVYDKCDGSEYDPSSKRCESDVIKTKCGAGVYYYNPSTQFCSGNSVYDKCDGSEYDPSSKRCENGAIVTKCGAGVSYYNPSTQFCSGNSVYNKCGGQSYTPENRRCENDIIETKCGTNGWYNAVNQRCQNDVIETKCGTNGWYDAANADLRCQSDVVETKCGSEWYNNLYLCTDGVAETKFKDARDNNIYKWVKIGTQVWMAENLNYNATNSRCYDDNTGGDSRGNCAKYGRLYNWTTAMVLQSSCNSNSCSSQISSKHKGICPSGWHIPRDYEWDALMTTVGGASTAGTELKATSGWNTNGSDTYGFSALPGGYGNSGGSFLNVGNYGFWWSSSEYNAGNAYYRGMYYNYELAEYNNTYKSYLFSVRCLQD